MATEYLAPFLLHGGFKALESLEPLELREARGTMFGQCLVDLVGVLLSLMRYPEDIDQLPEDEVDDLKRHRYDVADALRDVMRIIGGVSCLRQVLSILKQEVSFTDNVAPIGLVFHGRWGVGSGDVPICSLPLSNGH